jgi:hypothetical protein
LNSVEDQGESGEENPTPEDAMDAIRRKAESYSQKADAENNQGTGDSAGIEGGEKEEEGEEEPHEPYVREESFKGIHEELSWVMSVHPEERDIPYEPNEEETPYLLDEELFYDYVLP